MDVSLWIFKNISGQRPTHKNKQELKQSANEFFLALECTMYMYMIIMPEHVDSYRYNMPERAIEGFYYSANVQLFGIKSPLSLKLA